MIYLKMMIIYPTIICHSPKNLTIRVKLKFVGDDFFESFLEESVGDKMNVVMPLCMGILIL